MRVQDIHRKDSARVAAEAQKWQGLERLCITSSRRPWPAGCIVPELLDTFQPWIYSNCEEASSDVFGYIELFSNTRRRHGANDQLSPVEYEQEYLKQLADV